MANYDIGPRLGIEGEKTFSKSLRSIEANVKNLSSQMKLMTAEFGSNNSSVEALTAKNELLEKSITATEQKVSLLGKQYDAQVRVLANLEGALNKATKEYGANSAEAQKAQNAYNTQSVKVQALSSKINESKASIAQMTEELEKNKDAMTEVVTGTDKAEKALSAMGNAAKSLLGLKKNTDDVASSMASAHKHSLSFGDAVKAIVTSEAIVGGFRALGSAVSSLGKELISFAKGGVETASDLEEVQNVVNVTFGEDGAKRIEEFAKSAAGSFGMSSLSAKQFTGTMGAMLKSMNLDPAVVETMSMQLTGLAGDMASFYNIDAEDAFAKLRAGISGETEPLKQLGINMSVANMEAYALSQGINTAWKEMTQAEQATLRYQYIMETTKSAQGDFARTSDSFSNQQRILQLNMENLSVSIGSKLLPVLNQFTGLLNQLLSGETDLAGFMTKVGETVAQVGQQVLNSLPAMTDAGLKMLTAVGTGISNALPQILTVAGQIATQLYNGLMERLPSAVEGGMNTLNSFLDGVISGLPKVLQMGFDILMKIAEGVIAKIPDLVARLPQLISALAKFFTANFPKFVAMGGELIVQLVAGLVKSGPKLLEAAGDLLVATLTYFTNRAAGFVNIGSNIVNGILKGLKKSWSDVTAWIKNGVDGLLGIAKKVLGIKSPSREFAKIGQFSAEGIGVGFDSKIGAVGRKIKKDVSKVIPEVNSHVAVTGGGNSGISAGTADSGSMVSAFREALSGAAVYMDGKKVGKLITTSQNNTTKALGTSPALA